MAFLPLRKVDVASAAVAVYDAWLDDIAAQLDDPGCDRNEICRRILTDIWYPDLARMEPHALTSRQQLLMLQMDPRNVTLEPEYYAEIDVDRYARVKPLIWLWEMFDKSVLGENVYLGVRFRRLLAGHIFKRCGRNFKAFHFVKLSFGYNIEVGDDVVVHRHVLLDDRGPLRIGSRASIADFANIYTHTHALHDGRDVDMHGVTIGDGVRITYHATVLAGVQLHDDSMLGALAVATKDIASGDVALGIPAQPKLRKPDRAERPTFPPSGDPLAE